MKKLVIIIFVIFIALSVSFLAWAAFPLGPSEKAMAALTPGTDVQVIISDTGIVFKPVSVEPRIGLIFYPGGRVDHRSYAPLLNPIAAQGYMVILVKMPLNLAVLNPNKAEEIIAAHPKIEHWAVGGHSLGGAMAAKFVDDLPGAADSLVLWAAYPANNSSLRDQPGLKVLSIYGSLDALATPEKILSASSILPANTSWVEIQGGNHAQFGSYGSQPGDNLPLLVPEDQWAQVVSATTGFLKTLNNK